MSNRARALKAIRLEATDRIPHKEGLTCPAFETELTGIDAVRFPFSARLKTLEVLDIDMDLTPRRDTPPDVIFPEGEGVMTDSKGNTRVRWGAGTTLPWDHGSLFASMDEVLSFDPAQAFLLKGSMLPLEDISDIQPLLTLGLAELSHHVRLEHERVQAAVGERAEVPGFYYRTLFMWPLMLFGWENFARLALQFQGQFTRIWDGFIQVSEKVCRAYSDSGIRVFMSHDDLCGAQGPIFNPSWYRRYVYPNYERLWAPFKERGIKVLYVSDGKLDSVIDDVMSAGADGVLAEPATDLAAFARKYGKSAVFVGNVDGRVLTLGSKGDIRKEVDRVTSFGRDCPGYFYGVTNAITWDTPTDNIRFYFDYCAEAGLR